MADPIDTLKAAFAALEKAIEGAAAANWERVAKEVGAFRVHRLIMNLRPSTVGPDGPVDVKSAADRAEARSEIVRVIVKADTTRH